MIQRLTALARYTIPARVAGSIAAIFSVHGLPLPPKAGLSLRSGPGNPFKVTPKVISTTHVKKKAAAG